MHRTGDAGLPVIALAGVGAWVLSVAFLRAAAVGPYARAQSARLYHHLRTWTDDNAIEGEGINDAPMDVVIADAAARAEQEEWTFVSELLRRYPSPTAASATDALEANADPR